MAVTLELQGREEGRPRLPDLLAPGSRSIDPAASVFLPEGYLEPRACFDVGPSARDATDGQAPQQHDAADDEVVVLELADGSALISSAGRLRDALAQSHPEVLVGGRLDLEKLRQLAAAPRRDIGEAIGGLFRRIFSFVVGTQPDDITRDAAHEFGVDIAQLGVSWLGTKALMWAVERRLPRGPGLYAWSGGDSLAAQPATALDARVLAEPQKNPLLVFLHGTASHTLGSFGDLREAGADWWGALEQRFPGGVYGFEHRTLSESPIDNALALLAVLPTGAHVSFVSHSRGGLVGDLLCLAGLPDDAVANYHYEFAGTGDVDPAEAARVLGQLADAHGEQRGKLRQLAQVLAERQLVVQRYVRVASPAAGTKLASGNFDLFLSGLLSLIGRVPGLFGSPYYAAFKRVVIDIAKNRTNPHLVPGIEAMLPDAPLARLLRDVPARAGLEMSVIAGDIEGGPGLLQRLGVLLVDHLLFEVTDNDLVVDTPAMLAGIAASAGARVRFDRGADVSHFRYFENTDTRDALNDWLQADDVATVTSFRALPGPDDYAAALAAAAASRDVAADLPVVVVLPGVMGSHLGIGEDVAKLERIWFDPLKIAVGDLADIAWGQPQVHAQDLFGMFYGKLCQHLSASHRVERFPYDWRKPLDQLADDLAAFLTPLLAGTKQPVRLLAHSMGGLVVRACIHAHRELMNGLMARDGARLVMLGTPNQGAYSMVGNLIGKGDTLRTLVRLDLKHDMQQVLDIVAGFRGALQLLPKPGFRDTFQGQSDGGADGWNFQAAETWTALVPKVRDLWFGDGRVGQPSQPVLDSASWLWQRDGLARPALPDDYAARSVYVFGVAPNTPCGLREVDGRAKLVGTVRGDGTVSWESGRIGGIGAFYYLPAAHGDLPSTEEYFPALAELLAAGRTDQLATTPPQVRAVEEEAPVSYDAGPPGTDDADTAQRRLLGGSPSRRVGSVSKPQRRLEVTVRAMDLRFVTQPILVGYYDQDPIAGPQALIDRELLHGALSERQRLGLYPGPLGSATAVLQSGPPGADGERPMRGAIVTGLGSYDRPLTEANLAEAVRAGVLRYLVQTLDQFGDADRALPLAALLIGYNSSANLSVGASVEALVRGVLEANARFRETTRAAIRVQRLDIVELYTDTAISATYALRQLEPRLAPEAARLGSQLAIGVEMIAHESARQRLYDASGDAYWPRLIATAVERPDDRPDDCPDGAPRAAPRPGGPLSARVLLPDTLRFAYVGQRARAEVVVQQRQPGLVEKLVREQIRNPVWQESFGRMLFQLMVPHEFKDAARQMAQVVLVVDSFSANLPWEMMLADEPGRPGEKPLPMALRTAVVRQLATGSFRRQVRGSVGIGALVVGNPSLEGFVEAFPGTPEKPSKPPVPLLAAEREAQKVRDVLRGMGYEVTDLIGEDQPAKNVFAALYERPWRLIHISAHGVFDLRHADGRPRSGVLLSGGLLITAAEIAAMEVVPDLVVLNCCHLGKIESDPLRDGNKLAASVARELMEIGVRCVLVAGWAVSDNGAALFGETFYTELIERGRTFGEAVHAAREALWEADSSDITWGAFQAYGDPGWRVRPPRGTRRRATDSDRFVSPAELLDALAGVRAEVARLAGMQTERDRKARVAEVQALLSEKAQAGWQKRADVINALAMTWRDLNEFERARDSYLSALRAPDSGAGVPIRSIEQLANVEARLAERTGRATPLVASILRLEALVQSTDPAAQLAAEPEKQRSNNLERHALLASAYKRLASMQAANLLSSQLQADDQEQMGRDMHESLLQSVRYYRAATESEGQGEDDDPYPLLNRLALEAVVAAEEPSFDHTSALESVRRCARLARSRFASQHGFWNAVMQADALLVEYLLAGELGRAGDAGDKVAATLTEYYTAQFASVVANPSQVDSVVAQMELLSRFYDAYSLSSEPTRAAALRRTADRLLTLVQHLAPGRSARTDRPPSAPVSEAPRSAPGARGATGSRRAAKTTRRQP